MIGDRDVEVLSAERWVLNLAWRPSLHARNGVLSTVCADAPEFCSATASLSSDETSAPDTLATPAMTNNHRRRPLRLRTLCPLKVFSLSSGLP